MGDTNWVALYESKKQSGGGTDSQFGSLISEAARRHGVPEALVREVIRKESNFNPQARGAAGEGGLMQLMASTAKDLGVTDPFNPSQNIEGGTKYLAQLLQRYNGDINKALMAYNGGMGNVDRGTISSAAQGYAQEVGSRFAGANEIPAPMATAPAPEKNWVAEYEAKQQPAQQSAGPVVPAAATMNTRNLQVLDGKPKEKRSLTDFAVDSLPYVGGAIGGITGGISGIPAAGLGAIPGAIAGATVGGAGGEAWKQNINRLRGKTAPGTMTDAALDIGKAGLKEGAVQAVGGAVGKYVLSPAASAIAKSVFRPSAKALEHNPTLIADIYKFGAGHSAKSVAEQKAALTAARQYADSLVDDAAAQMPKTPFPSGVHRDNVLDALFTNPQGHRSSWNLATVGRMQPEGSMAQVGRAVEEGMRGPKYLSLQQLRDIQRNEGRLAGEVFEGAENATLAKQIHADQSAGAAEALHKRVPGLSAADDITRRRLAVYNTANDAVTAHAAKGVAQSAFDRMTMWKLAMGGAGGVLGGPAGAVALATGHHVATAPRNLATIGRGINNLQRTGAVTQATRVGNALLDESKKQQSTKKSKVDALYQQYKQR